MHKGEISARHFRAKSRDLVTLAVSPHNAKTHSGPIPLLSLLGSRPVLTLPHRHACLGCLDEKATCAGEGKGNQYEDT